MMQTHTTAVTPEEFREVFHAARREIAKVVVGQEDEIFYTNHHYWLHRDGGWYHARHHSDPFGYVESITATFYGPSWAPAVAFGFQQGYLNEEGSSSEPQHILVYDLEPDGSTLPPHLDPTGLILLTSVDAGDTFAPLPAVLDTEKDVSRAQMVADGDDVHISYEFPWAATEEIRVVSSHDGGLTLGSPVTISGGPRPNQRAYLAADRGTVAIQWDGPNPMAPGTEASHILIRTSTDAGATFSAEQDITSPWAAGTLEGPTSRSKGVRMPMVFFWSMAASIRSSGEISRRRRRATASVAVRRISSSLMLRFPSQMAKARAARRTWQRCRTGFSRNPYCLRPRHFRHVHEYSGL